MNGIESSSVTVVVVGLGSAVHQVRPKWVKSVRSKYNP